MYVCMYVPRLLCLLEKLAFAQGAENVRRKANRRSTKKIKKQ